MTNIEKVNKALAGADEDKIKEVLDFLGYKEDSKFIPEIDKLYYFINPFGNIHCYIWGNDEHDNHALLMSNVYQTNEEAEQALDFQTRKAKLIKEIEDSSDVFDWSDGRQNKYSISYSHINDVLDYTSWNMTQYPGRVYTTNSQFLVDLIATREDEVKELLFGIKL